jgi:hypothetical protein
MLERVENCQEHVELVVAGAREGYRQPVPVRRLPEGTVELLRSPGLVQGIAAGDVLRIVDPAKGTFEVLSRGGNLCVQLFRAEGIAPVIAWLLGPLRPLKARLDGSIDRGCVYTIPVSSGFQAIENVLSAMMAQFPDMEWYYGNVYGPDGETPLNWWRPT